MQSRVCHHIRANPDLSLDQRCHIQLRTDAASDAALQTHLKRSSFPDCDPGSLLDVAYGLAQPISKPQQMASMALWPQSGQAIAQLPLRSLHTNVEPLLSGALHSHNNHCKSPSAKCGGWDLVTVLAAKGEFPHQAIWSGKSADLQFVLFQCRGS